MCTSEKVDETVGFLAYQENHGLGLTCVGEAPLGLGAELGGDLRGEACA